MRETRGDEIAPGWPRLIGVLGGMGPHAHLELERRLLGALGQVESDQDYPDWLLASISSTPDRTRALVWSGEDPVPAMHRGLERLRRGGADFAVIACITAHAFLAELRRRTTLPLLDLLATTLTDVVGRHGPRARVGLLATDGTLESGLFPAAAAAVAPDLRWLSLPDFESGADLQRSRVMRPIYGIKSATHRDEETGLTHQEALLEAASALVEAGAEVVICGCTEISLAFGQLEDPGLPLADPLEIAARAALEIAAGRADLPS